MRSMQSKTFLKDQVLEYFSQLSDARKILIGFSGGPDSMCLMLLLDELKEQLGIEIVLGYYNHMLRSQDELSKELSFIRRIADHGRRIALRLLVGGHRLPLLSHDGPSAGPVNGVQVYHTAVGLLVLEVQEPVFSVACMNPASLVGAVDVGLTLRQHGLMLVGTIGRL